MEAENSNNESQNDGPAFDAASFSGEPTAGGLPDKVAVQVIEKHLGAGAAALAAEIFAEGDAKHTEAVDWIRGENGYQRIVESFQPFPAIIERSGAQVDDLHTKARQGFVGVKAVPELEAKIQADAQRQLDKMVTEAENVLTILEARTRAQEQIPLTPTIRDNVSAQLPFITAHFEHGTPADFRDEVLSVIRTARTSPSMEARVEANFLLKNTYRPLCSRNEHRPPAHAKEFAGGFGNLRVMIDTHLDNLLGGAKQRTNDRVIQELRGNIGYLKNIAKAAPAEQKQYDRFLMSIGARLIFGHLNKTNSAR